MQKLLLLDTFNFLHRAYHALPKTLRDSEGNPTNAIYGVTSMLITVFEALKPDYVIAAMDSKAPTFRVENFTAYKAHRRPMDTDLAQQIDKVSEVLRAFGVPQIEAPGYEADDIIGTIAKRFGDNMEIIIVSNDRDLWQLVTSNVVAMVPGKNGAIDWIGPTQVQTRLGFTPPQLIDYKALRGDPSDNIPGVAGIGDVTARNLIKTYGTLEEIYYHINEIEPSSLKEKLLNCAEIAVTSKELARVVTDAPITFELEDCRYSEFNRPQVIDALRKYNFKSLIKRLGFEPNAKKEMSPDNQLSLL